MSNCLIKQIGLFLSPEQADKLCVPDIQERIEGLAEEVNLADGLAEFVSDAADADESLTELQRTMVKISIKMLVEDLNSQKLSGQSLVSVVSFYDSIEGFLFCNSENAQEKRRNSAIDWCEQSDDPSEWTFQLQRLDRPVHSWGGYQCTGPVSPELKKLLEDGIRLPVSLRSRMLSMMKKPCLAPDTQQRQAREDFNTYFKPEVDPLCSFLAMKLGLLKPGVTRQAFEAALVPGILTTFH